MSLLGADMQLTVYCCGPRGQTDQYSHADTNRRLWEMVLVLSFNTKYRLRWTYCKWIAFLHL